MRVYRQFRQARDKGERVTVLTMFREPFDWFRSCIAQEIDDHINTFRYSLDRGGIAWDSDEEAVTLGLELLLTRILGALEVAGGIDNLSMEVRRGLNQTMAFADDRDFEQFLFLLGRFLAPHFWFATNLRPALETDLQDMERLSIDLFRARKEWGNIYLLRYEQLQGAFESALRDLGYADPPQLAHSNISAEKPFSDAISAVFASPAAHTCVSRRQTASWVMAASALLASGPCGKLPTMSQRRGQTSVWVGLRTHCLPRGSRLCVKCPAMHNRKRTA